MAGIYSSTVAAAVRAGRARAYVHKRAYLPIHSTPLYAQRDMIFYASLSVNGPIRRSLPVPILILCPLLHVQGRPGRMLVRRHYQADLPLWEG